MFLLVYGCVVHKSFISTPSSPCLKFSEMQAVSLTALLLLIGLLTVEKALTDNKQTEEQGCTVGDELPGQMGTGNVSETPREVGYFEKAMKENPELAKQFNKLKNTRSVNILVTGKTGTGKSTLINGLVGEKVAKEGEELDPETVKVDGYTRTVKGIAMTFYDSPGLQDGKTNEVEYMKDMEHKCKNIDLVLFTIRMDDTRLQEGEKEAMHKLTCAFGASFWEHSVFVLTFANKVEDPADHENSAEYFNKRLTKWTAKLPETLLQRSLKKCPNGEVVKVPIDVAHKIPIVPAGYYKQENLPGHPYWFSEFWQYCFMRMNEDAQLLLLKVNEDRFKPVKEVSKSDFNQQLYQQPIVIHEGSPIKKAIASAVGAGIGGTMFGPVGAALGSMLGLFF